MRRCGACHSLAQRRCGWSGFPAHDEAFPAAPPWPEVSQSALVSRRDICTSRCLLPEAAAIRRLTLRHKQPSDDVDELGRSRGSQMTSHTSIIGHMAAGSAGEGAGSNTELRWDAFSRLACQRLRVKLELALAVRAEDPTAPRISE